jgi:hypothetical protein
LASNEPSVPWKAGLRAITACTSASPTTSPYCCMALSMIARCTTSSSAAVQAVAQRLLGLRPLAGLALDLLELAVEAVAHLVDRDRRAADQP